MTRRTLLGACGGAAFAAQPVVRPGWDWSLPDSVQPLPYSGFVTWNNRRFDPSITVRGVMIPWSKISPKPGVYDFQPVEQAIAESQAAGMRVGLHLKGVERANVPDWVIERYRVPVLDVIPLQENQPWRLQIVPPWHADVLREYAALLQAFGRTSLPRRPEVVYAYIHGISPSRGEELFLRPVDIDDWEKKAGLTPKGLGDCLRTRLAAMLEAFRGVEYKLAWMTASAVAAGQKGREEYARQTAGLWEQALAGGAGWRGGGIDFQHVLLDAPYLGSSITPEGYVAIDESVPLRDGRRFVGDENEEYGKYWEWRFGPYEQHAHRHRFSSLHGVQLGENFQFVSAETLKLNPELNQYVRRVQGRRAENSPDAWAYLREYAVRVSSGVRVVKNLERWLVQRDVEGCRSVACERIDRHPLRTDPPDRHYDLDARRTDRAGGQHSLAFQLAEPFWKRPAPAQVKVTFYDRSATRWRLVSGQETSPPVDNLGDGLLKTATLPAAALGSSFRLVAEGPGDLSATFVRVLRV